MQETWRIEPLLISFLMIMSITLVGMHLDRAEPDHAQLPNDEITRQAASDTLLPRIKQWQPRSSYALNETHLQKEQR